MASVYIFFWGHNPQEGDPWQAHVFSNWLPSRFRDPMTDIVYENAEQYMMARKALTFKDNEMHTKILKTPDPKKVKALGRKVSNFDAKVWDAECYGAVLDGNRLKFTQNPELRRIILNTGSHPLAEASPRDRIWGIGLGAQQARQCDPSSWPGKNLLGRVLMQLREELRAEEAEVSRSGGSGEGPRTVPQQYRCLNFCHKCGAQHVSTDAPACVSCGVPRV